MFKICQSAVEQGITEIGLTEHYDLNPQDPCYQFFDADAWWTELLRCREAFAGSLQIKAGVELGEPHLYPEQVRELLDRYPWDYALGSLHWVDGQMVFEREYFTRSADQAYRIYFQELARMAHTGQFDILAHMDVVKRYGFDYYGLYDPQEYEPEIRTVLHACAERGIALEINTSTLRRPISETTPALEVLRWYLEEGGDWITFGSDAHRIEHLGFGHEHVKKMLIDAGGNGFAHFERRTPSRRELGEGWT
jgi:histidinol-phosphatase (PHP family)